MKYFPASIFGLMISLSLLMHIILILSPLPPVYWLVSQETAYLVGLVEAIVFVPLVLLSGWKLIVWTHDHAQTQYKDIFRDENEILE